MAKQRGRPKSARTLERERIKTMFKNHPAHIPRMTEEAREKIKVNLAASKKLEEELIADYSPTISRNLIFELVSLGDESMYGHEEAALKKYEKLKVAEHSGRLSGAQKTADKAKARANIVWGKNQDLVKRIGISQTVHSASQKILNEWVSRGDNGKKPSIRSIQNWYRKYFLK